MAALGHCQLRIWQNQCVKPACTFICMHFILLPEWFYMYMPAYVLSQAWLNKTVETTFTSNLSLHLCEKNNAFIQNCNPVDHSLPCSMQELTNGWTLILQRIFHISTSWGPFTKIVKQRLGHRLVITSMGLFRIELILYGLTSMQFL